jgi:hypothetical protein
MTPLERQLRGAFTAFGSMLRSEQPFARENELVNLFAFGPLLDAIAPELPIASARQVGIEVAVRQPARTAAGKLVVRKDLVIWSDPGQTAWAADGSLGPDPLSVIEWKGGRARSRTRKAARERGHDLAFLTAMTRVGTTEGYSVLAVSSAGAWELAVARVVAGRVDPDWFNTRASAGA